MYEFSFSLPQEKNPPLLETCLSMVVPSSLELEILPPSLVLGLSRVS